MNNRLVRIAAVVSSLTLAVGFIGYRTGAFTFGQTAPASQAATPDQTTQDRTLMYSSKSGAIVLPSTEPSTSSKPAAAPERTIMSGSKSLIITSVPTVPATTTTAPARVTFPGSKSDIMIPPPLNTPNAPAK